MKIYGDELTKNNGKRIPSREECDELMARYSMLPNIREHSIQVMNVSLAITDNLRKNFIIDRDLVIAAALLHDITKTRSLKTGERHDTTGGELLRDLGFPTTAEIVEQHVLLKNFDPNETLHEREIVFYADKRVLHDNIVTIDERLYDLINRYGKTETIRELILQNKGKVLTVEKKIADCMTVDLDQAIRSANENKRRHHRDKEGSGNTGESKKKRK